MLKKTHRHPWLSIRFFNAPLKTLLTTAHIKRNCCFTEFFSEKMCAVTCQKNCESVQKNDGEGSATFCRFVDTGEPSTAGCCENQRASPCAARGHTSMMPVAAAGRPARRRSAVGERRVACNRPNECCSCAFFRFNSLATVWIRSMADIQLKTVRSRSQLYCRHQKRSLTVGRLLTTLGTLLQSRSVTVTRLTMSSTVALRPRERPTPSKAGQHCAHFS